MTDIQTAANSDFAKVAFTDIIVDDDNVRSELHGIGDLADSIWAAGLLNPLTVRFNGDGKVHLTAGFRRHAALKLLIDQDRWEGPIPVNIRTDEDDESRAVAMLVENLHREDLDVADEALGIQALIVKHGFSIEDVALNIARSEQTVKDRLTLCSLVPEAFALLRSGKLTIAGGLALAKADPKLQAKLIKKPDPYDLQPHRIASAISSAKSSEFTNQVKARLKEESITIDKEGYRTPEGYVRGSSASNVGTMKQVDEFINLIGRGGDSKVRITKNYNTPKVDLLEFKKLDEKALAEAKAKEAESRAEQEARWAAEREANALAEAERMRTAIDPTIVDWYEACRAIQLQIEASDEQLEAAMVQHRVAFIRELTTSDVAGALIRFAAREFGRNLDYHTKHYPKSAAWALEVLGLPADTVPTGGWESHILNNKKLTVLAAAGWAVGQDRYSTKAPQLVAQFKETLITRGHAPVVQPFPPAPDALNEILRAAQGMTFEEANVDEITWDNIDATIEALMDGDLDLPEPDEASEPPGGEDDEDEYLDDDVADEGTEHPE